EEIVRGCWSTLDRSRPECAQQAHHHWIWRYPFGGHQGRGLCNPSVRGNGRLDRVPGDEALRFKVKKEKSLVLPNGAANGPAKIMVSQLAVITKGCRLRKSIIAIEVVESAMKIVRPGLDRHVDHRPGVAPEIRSSHALL